MEITIQIKTVYGQERIYPVCDDAKLFAQLADTKTLSRAQIEIIKLLGYSIIVQPQTL